MKNIAEAIDFHFKDKIDYVVDESVSLGTFMIVIPPFLINKVSPIASVFLTYEIVYRIYYLLHGR